MGGAGRLSRFCLSRIATHARTPSEAKPIAEGPRSNSSVREASALGRDCKNGQHGHRAHGESKSEWDTTESVCSSRKIMVVVDSSPEAKRALLWALSHTVQDQDVLVLLHVTRLAKPLKPIGSSISEKEDCQNQAKEQQIDEKSFQLLNSLKMLSKSRRPEVEVEIVAVEGKEKGPTIVSQAKKHGASLLVLGQRKPSLLWRMLITWAGTRGSETAGNVVEYCIQNANCMTLAVRRKSRKAGGYLITSRRQKNFWLLA